MEIHNINEVESLKVTVIYYLMLQYLIQSHYAESNKKKYKFNPAGKENILAFYKSNERLSF